MLVHCTSEASGRPDSLLENTKFAELWKLGIIVVDIVNLPGSLSFAEHVPYMFLWQEFAFRTTIRWSKTVTYQQTPVTTQSCPWQGCADSHRGYLGRHQHL